MGRAGPRLEGAPVRQVALAATEDGRIVQVAVETIPAPAYIQATQAAQIGVKAGVASTSMMAVASGGGGGGPAGGSGSSGSSRSAPATGRAAEETFIARLKERFPRLKSLDIRPKARPSGSRYVGPSEETPEVGGSPQYRTQASGAPEFAFEERMRTSQGNYSLIIVDKGVVMEIDGISGDGWLENIKIEQKISSVDAILARLRVEADFVEAYGLKGVQYSIGPETVGDEVEARAAEQQLRNVFRVE